MTIFFISKLNHRLNCEGPRKMFLQRAKYKYIIIISVLQQELKELQVYLPFRQDKRDY
jgi:hypothetical protein